MKVHSPEVPAAGLLADRLAVVELHISCSGPTEATGVLSTYKSLASEVLAQGAVPVAVRVSVTVTLISVGPGVYVGVSVPCPAVIDPEPFSVQFRER